MNNNSFVKKVREIWNKSAESQDDIIRYFLSIENLKSFQDWKSIIVAFLSVDTYFIEKHAERIIELINKGQDEFLKVEVNDFLINYLKEESCLSFNYSNFFYLLNQQHKTVSFEFRQTFNKEELETICVRRLERYVLDSEEDIYKAFEIFYSCWDYVDEENKVHILKDALLLIRKYVERIPEKYLRFILRHKYQPPNPDFSGGYYVFVLEPYTRQIFEGWDNYSNYLNKQLSDPEVDRRVVECNMRFLQIYEGHHYKKIPILAENLPEYRLCSYQIDKILEGIK